MDILRKQELLEKIDKAKKIYTGGNSFDFFESLEQSFTNLSAIVRVIDQNKPLQNMLTEMVSVIEAITEILAEDEGKLSETERLMLIAERKAHRKWYRMLSGGDIREKLKAKESFIDSKLK